MSQWSERAAYLMARQRCVRCGKQDAYTMNKHKMCYECTIKARKYQNKHNRLLRAKKEMQERSENDSTGTCEKIQCHREASLSTC